LAQVAVLVLTGLSLLLALLIASEGEDAGAALFLPFIVYGIGAGVYHTILYVSFGHTTSSQQKGTQKSSQAMTHVKLSKDDKIAIHIKWCNAFFLAALLCLILSDPLESELLETIGGFLGLGFLYCVIAIPILVWESVWKYVGIILFSGITFIVAYSKAITIVRKAGYKIGLFGPKEITFFGHKLIATRSEQAKIKTPIAEKKQPTSSHPAKPQTANQWFLKIDSLESAKKAVAQGYVAAYIIAGLTAVIALVALASEQAIAGIDEWAMLDALLMAVAGIGMQFYSRTAALGALILYALGKAVSLSEGNMNTTGAVMSVLFFLALLNGVRGAFAYHRFQFAYAAKS
jgi:hypothetical protein